MMWINRYLKKNTNKKKGIALVYSTLIICLLSVLAAGFLLIASSNTKAAVKYDESTKMKLLAESGIENAYALMKKNLNGNSNAVIDSSELIKNIVPFTVSDTDGSCTVKVEQKDYVGANSSTTIPKCILITSTAVNSKGDVKKEVQVYIDPRKIFNDNLDLIFNNALAIIDNKSDTNSETFSVNNQPQMDIPDASSDINLTQMYVNGNMYLQGSRIDLSPAVLNMTGNLNVNSKCFYLRPIVGASGANSNWIRGNVNIQVPSTYYSGRFTVSPAAQAGYVTNTDFLLNYKTQNIVSNLKEIRELKIINSDNYSGGNLKGYTIINGVVKSLPDSQDGALNGMSEDNLKNTGVVFFNIKPSTTLNFNSLSDEATEYILSNIIHHKDSSYKFSYSNPSFEDMKKLSKIYVVYLIDGDMNIPKEAEAATSINNIIYCTGTVNISGSIFRYNSSIVANKVLVNNTNRKNEDDIIQIELSGIPSSIRAAEPTDPVSPSNPSKPYNMSVDAIGLEPSDKNNVNSVRTIVANNTKLDLVSPRNYEREIQEYLLSNTESDRSKTTNKYLFADGARFCVLDWQERDLN